MKTVVGLAFLGLLVGCGAAGERAPMSPRAEAASAAYAPSGAMPGAMASTPAPTSAPTATAESTAPIAVERPTAARLPQAGLLTAGVWDDNLNFAFYKPYAQKFGEAHGQDFQMFSASETEAARVASLATATPKTELDVQLVLDTTGSMGDELSYLQSEFDSIASQVKGKFPGVTPRWSLVLYRDHGDEYLTRAFDFTTDTNKFREDLKAQSAAGGGDTPEAVVEGLGKGLAQHWRGGAVARIAFWVADAPAHPGEGTKLASVIRDAQAKGVHLYPIASSDADDAAEYQMRSAAQMTGGRYLFLTNDSGIGNGHAEPHIPCYSVTRLDHALVRMIQVEMSGKRVESEAQQVIRKVGQPDKDGTCKLPSGLLVASY